MPSERRVLRCAVYTRKSSEHGLEQDFNSLDAQREAGEAYIKSQSHEGWKLIRTPYADRSSCSGCWRRSRWHGPNNVRYSASPSKDDHKMIERSHQRTKMAHIPLDCGGEKSVHGEC